MKSTVTISFLALSFALMAAPGEGQRAKPLLGTVDGDQYRHVSQAFQVKITSKDITDSQAGVDFKHSMFGAITAWNSVSFLKPELSAGKLPRQALDAIVDGFRQEMYRRKKVKPAVLLMQEDTILGRPSLYAKVSFPEYPGTGVTVFNEKGRQVDADFVAFFHIIPIADLGLQQRNLPIEYLLAMSMNAAVTEAQRPAAGDDFAVRHAEFVKGLEILSKAGTAPAAPQ